jgi:hypothetical protein
MCDALSGCYACGVLAVLDIDRSHHHSAVETSQQLPLYQSVALYIRLARMTKLYKLAAHID